jgi:hypothetical protein
MYDKNRKVVIDSRNIIYIKGQKSSFPIGKIFKKGKNYLEGKLIKKKFIYQGFIDANNSNEFIVSNRKELVELVKNKFSEYFNIN